MGQVSHLSISSENDATTRDNVPDWLVHMAAMWTDQDTGSAATWNELSLTFTPAAGISVVTMVIECDNNSGTDYAVWLDDITVT